MESGGYTEHLDFERDYPNAKVVVLGQNYRSTQTILKVASEVIQRNTSAKLKSCGPRMMRACLLPYSRRITRMRKHNTLHAR